jgi:hypothetical protein
MDKPYNPQGYKERKVYLKNWRDNNKEHLNEFYRKYYHQDVEKQRERMKIRVICDICGCETNKHNLKRHQNSKRCQPKS